MLVILYKKCLVVSSAIWNTEDDEGIYLFVIYLTVLSILCGGGVEFFHFINFP
jgi:hypothetical protein